MCMTFVALTVIEFNYVLRLRYHGKETSSEERTPSKIDRYSARILMGLYVVCVLVYWIYFSIVSNS